MPNIASIIRDHVSLSIRCMDRLYVNGYLAKLQTSGQLAYFMTEHLGQPIPSPVVLDRQRKRFQRRLDRWGEEQEIPVIRFERGVRKDDVALARRGDFAASEGVVFVGVAQEKCRSFRAHRRQFGRAVTFDFSRQWVFVNHYYFYFQDREWGPGFLKVASYAPYPVKLCLNGHAWAKQQLRREGVGFESLDNGFFPARTRIGCRRSAKSSGRRMSRRVSTVGRTASLGRWSPSTAPLGTSMNSPSGRSR